MSKNKVAIGIVILVLAAGAWYLTRPKYSEPIPIRTPIPTPTEASSGAAVTNEKNLVNITASGFSPKDITVKAGESVTWANGDSIDHTVNSAVHPTHLAYPPLNLDTVSPGEKKSLIFPKAGTYKYHDHLNPSLFGSVTVE